MGMAKADWLIVLVIPKPNAAEESAMKRRPRRDWEKTPGETALIEALSYPDRSPRRLDKPAVM
jgi:hypothetical protein